MNNFSKEYSCTSLTLPNDTLLEKIMPVVIEQHEFEYRDETIKFDLFDFW